MPHSPPPSRTFLRTAAMIAAAAGLVVAFADGAGRPAASPVVARKIDPAVARAADDFTAAAARVDPSCVGLTVITEDGRRETGAGFVVRAGGLVATAAHVVEGARHVTARLPDGRLIEARVIGADALSDVALLHIDADLPPVTVAPPGEPRRGAIVAAIGDPLGFAGTLTVGHVSSPARPWGETNPYDFLQHDAALNPGSSGGALVDRDGRLVGMNVAIADGSRRNVGIGLAVPAELVLRIADRLAAGGPLPRPRLGVRLRATDSLRAAIPALTNAGAVVEAVAPGSPAAAAGLAAGQIVVAAEGRPVGGVRDIARALEPKAPGETFRLVVMVGDDVRPIVFTLTGLPAGGGGGDVAEAPGPAALGLDLDPGEPPRIRAVTEDTPAASAGLRPGDQVLAVGLGRIDPDEPQRSLAAAAGAAGVGGIALLVRRDDQTRWVVLGRAGRLDDGAPFGSNAEAATSHLL